MWRPCCLYIVLFGSQKRGLCRRGEDWPRNGREQPMTILRYVFLRLLKWKLRDHYDLSARHLGQWSLVYADWGRPSIWLSNSPKPLVFHNPPPHSMFPPHLQVNYPSPSLFPFENLPCLVKQPSQSVSSRLRSRCSTDFCLQMSLCSFFTPQPPFMYAATHHQQR